MTLDDFNREYLSFHSAKEDLFWTTYMGVEPDAKAFERAEAAYKTYISDPSHIAEVRAAIEQTHDETTRHGHALTARHGLDGWLKFFQANAIESPEGRDLQQRVIEAEGRLFEKRSKYRLHYRNEKGEEQVGTTNVMASNIAASGVESVRESSHKALLDLEQWVLANGFLELVKLRNAFARALGWKNYFAYRVHKNEGLSVDELFAILDEFESLTREKCFAELKKMAQKKGAGILKGHNVKYAFAGDAEKELDPYFPFENALKTWCESFSRLGIRYRGAELHLDLIDRVGKYENGFMHGPGPCYFDRGEWRAARINFTSNAVPNQLGSGRRALVTLFHEGGHAAHFSNITQNAPCFSQEFPPTSMAYAETQSMFCDSLVSDADWMLRYAKDRSGNPLPESVIRLSMELEHPFRAFSERSILVVPVFERRLYELPESELTPEKVTALARRCEKEVLGVECSPRPLMAVPHLLGSESACSYQGYLLAHMAVYQTRAHFLRKYGYLTDNPHVGADLEKSYWNPGNSLTHSQTIESLTGQKLSGKELAAHCNLSNDELWKMAKRQMESAKSRAPEKSPVDARLEARIHIVHGAQELGNNLGSPEEMWSGFQSWIRKEFPARS
jgi:oligoendopeptidase F